MVHRRLIATRTLAQQAIRAGLVTIDGAPATKAATQVSAAQELVITAPPRPFVSRGGEKLAHGLDQFTVTVDGRRCLDAGVSTGGFTDCLLSRGAAHVWAYDVGYGQVHESLRTDPRVSVHERTNVRDLTPDDIPGPRPSLLVADLSFISLARVLPVLVPLLDDDADADAVVLIKPQFEAERGEVGKGGVVRDPHVWERALARVRGVLPSLGWGMVDVVASPLLGPAGNVEFLAHLQRGAPTSDPAGFVDAITAGERLRATGSATAPDGSTGVAP